MKTNYLGKAKPCYWLGNPDVIFQSMKIPFLPGASFPEQCWVCFPNPRLLFCFFAWGWEEASACLDLTCLPREGPQGWEGSEYRFGLWVLRVVATVDWIVPCVCTWVQLCLTLGDPMDCSSPGSCVQRIFQARVLEWVAVTYSKGSSQPRDRTRVSCGFCISKWILYHCTTGEGHPLCTGHFSSVTLFMPHKERSSLHKQEKTHTSRKWELCF